MDNDRASVCAANAVVNTRASIWNGSLYETKKVFSLDPFPQKYYLWDHRPIYPMHLVYVSVAQQLEDQTKSKVAQNLSKLQCNGHLFRLCVF